MPLTQLTVRNVDIQALGRRDVWLKGPNAATTTLPLMSNGAIKHVCLYLLSSSRIYGEWVFMGIYKYPKIRMGIYGYE